MNDIYYRSCSGEMLYLDRNPFWMQTGDFLDYEWIYNIRNDKIVGFQKEVTEKEFLITVSGKTETEYANNWNKIHDVFEKDICETTPGKLYFGDYYLNCYIFAAEKTEWEYDCCMHDNVYYLVTDHPFWLKESTLLILPASDPVAAGLTYDYTYDYTYGENGLSVFFKNDHFTACDFKLKAYGPFDSLAFAINSNMYEVDADCGEGESLVIDTKAQTITKIDAYGNAWNAFGDQNFDYNNFAKIPAGENTLSYSRDHALELTFYQERSEPKWNSSEVEEDTTNVLMTEEGYILATEDGGALILEE